jgi:hypothetical protein
MARPSHPPRLDYSNYTWRRNKCRTFNQDEKKTIPNKIITTQSQTIAKKNNCLLFNQPGRKS